MSIGRTASNVKLETDERYPLGRAEIATPAAQWPSLRSPLAPVPPPRRSRWRLGFIVCVVLPTLIAAGYLYGFASDQYVSDFRFRLRHAQTVRMDPASALAGLTGSASPLQSMTDSEIVVQYLQSRQVLEDLAPILNLEKIYARAKVDWLARLNPGEPIENRLRYWRHVVDPFFDMTTGIVTVKVRAFERAEAMQVASALLLLAERLVNNLSERAMTDKVAYAKQEVAEKLAEMRASELAVREFRNANEILLPTIQATEASGLDTQLRAAIANARASVNALRAQGVAANGPQIRTLENRIAGLEAEMARQQTRLTSGSAPGESTRAPTLATQLTRYEALQVDAKIAAGAYEMAVTAEQRARDEASQQQIYLDAFVKPGLPERSLYPIRWRILLQVCAGAFVLWCLGMLIWRAVLDHVD